MKVRISEEHGYEKLVALLHNHWHEILGWAGVMLAPIKILLLNIYVLVLVDLITGIWRSWAKGGWRSIASSKLRRTVTKMISYSTALLVVNLLERQFLPELSTVRVVAAYIALTEIKSIFENLEKVTNAPIWNALIDKLRLPRRLYLGSRKPRRSRRGRGR
jgi:phage-related holin